MAELATPPWAVDAVERQRSKRKKPTSFDERMTKAKAQRVRDLVQDILKVLELDPTYGFKIEMQEDGSVEYAITNQIR